MADKRAETLQLMCSIIAGLDVPYTFDQRDIDEAHRLACHGVQLLDQGHACDPNPRIPVDEFPELGE